MFAAIAVLFVLPWLDRSPIRSAKFRPVYFVLFWVLLADCILLGFCGAMPAEGIWVVLFPEGTRMPPGEPGAFQPGGAFLAAATAAPVLVVSHDAGSYWPAHSFRKRPGTIRFRVAPPLETAGKTSKEINADAAAVMSDLTASIVSTRRPD